MPVRWDRCSSCRHLGALCLRRRRRRHGPIRRTCTTPPWPRSIPLHRRLNLRDQSQVLSSILRYNNSMPYAQNVLGWPRPTPPASFRSTCRRSPGPLRHWATRNWRTPKASDDLPMNMHGLPSTDPLAPDAADRPQRGPKQRPAAVVDAAAGSLVHGNLISAIPARLSRCSMRADPGGHAARPV